MGDVLAIREFAPDDAAAVAALWRRVFHDDSQWRAPEAVFERRRRRQAELFLVATLDGGVVGTTLAGYDGHRGWLYRVAVAPEHERLGIGRALVAEAELRLRQLGCLKVNLQIEGENRDVVAFYARLGWRVEDRVSMGKALVGAAARARGATEIGVYLPQVGFAWHELRARVQLCDREGVHSVWFMDHLYPPGLPAVPSFEAWTTATALAVVTERIRLGHLVLANGFRHPALLAKMAITLDHASGGRLDLGLGSGSYPAEYAQFGLEHPPERVRAEQLDEALQVLRLLFSEEAPTFRGTTLPARRRAQRATPAATPASSDPRRGRGRAPHPADRGASRRRLELPDVRARGAAAQARGAAGCVRGHRTRPGIAPRHRGGGARARAARRIRWQGRATWRCAASRVRAGASRRAAGAERRR